jgi:cell division protein FtsQ
MAKLKRSGGQGVRRAARSQSRASGARRARARTGGLLSRAMGVLPFDEDQWGNVFMAMILVAFLLLVGGIASVAGVPAMAHAEMTRLAQSAGFKARVVKVTGTQQMDESKVYAIALGQRDRAMPLVDIEQLREEIEALKWVEEARVSVQLPETLAIDIVERVPHAVLVKPDHLALVDLAGNELGPVSRNRAEAMLRVAGPGAANQVAALDILLDAVPALKTKVDEAEWVGNRRWDLTFGTGQRLALPEGETEAARALVQFAKLEGQNQLIGGKVTVFDMRNPPRIFMRVPGRSEQQLSLVEGSQP